MSLTIKIPFATKEQELILKAALMKGDAAVKAWQNYAHTADLEGHPDNGSFRTMPLLFSNLQQLRVKHPFMHRLKGIYRQSWYLNQRLFHDMSNVLQSLHKAEIKTMLLKGAALSILHYKNYGVRPMADIDVLVHTSQASSAIAVLQKTGWTPVPALRDGDLTYRHSKQFIDHDGKEFDLHWHLLFDSCGKDADSDFWDKAVPVTFANVPTLALNPTDMLLHIIVHGVKWNSEPPIRWIADSMTILNSPDTDIDWTRLMDQSRKHGVVLHIKTALLYLQSTYHASIPQSVIDSFQTIPVSRFEQIEYRQVTAQPVDGSGSLIKALLGGFPRYLMEYRRLIKNRGILAQCTGLPEYLQYRLNKQSYRELLAYLFSRCIIITKEKLHSAISF